MSILPEPNKPIKAKDEDPNLLLIISHPKVGKTHALSQLPNSLLIDLGSSAKHFGGVYIDINEQAVKHSKHKIAMVKSIANTIRKANQKKGDYIYDYIIIDTLSELEELAEEYCNLQYRKSNAGKDFKGGNIIKELEYGGGYAWLRDSFNELYNSLKGLARISTIFTAHTKLSSIKKDGKDLSIRDVNLTGKIRLGVALEMRAIGYLYRGEDGKTNYLTFENKGEDLNVGTSIKHLSNKTFTLSTIDGNRNLKTNWDQIFINLTTETDEKTSK